MRPLVVVAHAFTRFTPSTATTPAETRERVVSVAPPAQSSTVVNEGAVRDERIGVPPTVGMLVLSMSVNHHFTIRVAVAPRFTKYPVAHRISGEPRLSVLSVSETSEVFIATAARLSRAVVAPEPPEAAIVTVHALPVPPVVRVIPLHSISCTLPPLAESVTV